MTLPLLADVVQSDDIGMIERRGGPRLLLEARAPGGIVREFDGQHLERDLATQAGVARAIHFAHPARPERGDDLVWAEAGCRAAGA